MLEQRSRKLSLSPSGVVSSALGGDDSCCAQGRKVSANPSYATAQREVAINPVAALPHKTLFHELAHILLGHAKDETLQRSVREVEAEGVALLCCEAFGLDGAVYARGYLQHWLEHDELTETMARRIMATARASLPQCAGISVVSFRSVLLCVLSWAFYESEACGKLVFFDSGGFVIRVDCKGLVILFVCAFEGVARVVEASQGYIELSQSMECSRFIVSCLDVVVGVANCRVQCCDGLAEFGDGLVGSGRRYGLAFSTE